MEVLQLIVKRLAGKSISWILIGSSNLALQGVAVPESDIDIATDKEGAYAIEELLAEFLIQPVEYSESEQFRSHFGRFLIEGIEVEVMGELEVLDKHIDRWVHVSDASFATKFSNNEITIPVMELAHEIKFYKIRGENEKLHAIVQHMIEKYK